jgi:phosphoribosyl-ATP pyrophosphohydrolase/phosphoribosyl-AMP cyclohydrolase/histidinol dehydrogenase
MSEASQSTPRAVLRRVPLREARAASLVSPDPKLSEGVARILREVGQQGETALQRWAEQLGDCAPGAPLFLTRANLAQALDAIPREQAALLERSAARVRTFAEAQRACLQPLRLACGEGSMGHELLALDAVGCYAPGGRYPLPSSVLMTVVPARVAGVEQVWVASPRPAPITLAAAAIAGADGLLACGGAHALAAMAQGIGPLPRVDFLCGPGNRWVTEAKRQLMGSVGVDMLAGPSELLVLADASADAEEIAADLIAQAEHDEDARPILVCLDPALPQRVEAAWNAQLADLPTAATARTAIARQGMVFVCADLSEAIEVCNQIAPEHLEVRLTEPNATRAQSELRHAGALFCGQSGAEVLGDYGAGPNHVLPTGASARLRGGLSVFDFVRVRTFLDLAPGPDTAQIAADAAALARLEGLEGHARAAERRTR